MNANLDYHLDIDQDSDIEEGFIPSKLVVQ